MGDQFFLPSPFPPSSIRLKWIKKKEKKTTISVNDHTETWCWCIWDKHHNNAAVVVGSAGGGVLHNQIVLSKCSYIL